MTYNDIKLATLQKMFNDVTTTEPTDVTSPYLEKMVYVCNCAIQRIASQGFNKKKYLDVTLNVPENLLKSYDNIYRINAISEDREFISPKGKSFYFEMCGNGTAEIYVGNRRVSTISNSDDTSFTKHKNILQNTNNEEVKILFKGGSSYLVKNIAIYDMTFNTADDIYEISEMKFFDMESEANDFYKFDSDTKVVCDSSNKSYSFIGEKTFTVPGYKSGYWKVPYIAYPQIITKNTTDDTVIDIPDNVAGLIPYYMASELYLEDDSGLCVGWRNKFESELITYAAQKLNAPINKMKFVSLAGENYGSI